MSSHPYLRQDRSILSGFRSPCKRCLAQPPTADRYRLVQFAPNLTNLTIHKTGGLIGQGYNHPA